MMVHHDNHHRPFPSPSPSSSSKYDSEGTVPTATANGRFYSTGSAAAVNGGLGATPLQHQYPPFQGLIPPPSSSSYSGMGYPFTQAQWRELERQAMIYKYMVASVPVPPDLLFPLPSSVPSSHYSLGGGSYGLRFGNNGGDPEPGRCRRTDGKKWRCSRDAAPDQKYCERHLNRGRPRSRKHVEVNASVSPSKKTRHCHASNAPLPSTCTTINNGPTVSQHHHSHQAFPMLRHGNGGFEQVDSPHNKEPRGLDWLMIGGDTNMAEETLSLNSNYNTTKPNQFNEYLFPLSNSDVISTPRGFIDAWSDNSSKQSCPISSPHDEKLASPSDEMGHIHMGLGVSHWTRTSDPGSSSLGPLGEVFRSTPSSPNSGSLTPGSSMGRSEITVQWFSPN